MCVEILSAFPKPYRFGSRPCYITQLNFANDVIENIPVNDPVQYKQMSDCPYPVILGWLNKRGGWDFFSFNQKHIHLFEVSESKTFINQQNERTYLERGSVMKKIEVKSQYLSSSDMELIKYMLSSIKTYYFPDGELSEPIAVIVPDQSIRVRQEGENKNTLDFEIQFSALDLIQTI